MTIEIINPPDMGAVLGPYSQIAKAGPHIYIAGQVGTGDTFEAQCEGLYANIEKALTAAGATWANIVQFTSYLTSRADIPKYMAWRATAYPIFFPNRVYPTHTLLIVGGLVKEELLVEVTATAYLP
jgi:enamine deaminase RidA (YjgF/YER057c/UK114 family)